MPAANPPEASTVELVQRAQRGDSEARQELFTRYGARVLTIARVRLGARLRGVLESEDILQEALLEALRGLERFEMRDESSLIRWLAQLVEHRITARASYHGAAKRAGSVVGLAAADESRDGEQRGGQPRTVQVASLLPGPRSELERNEARDTVQAALAELSERQRELVLLRDYAGASWEEVARDIGAPSPAAARMLHARALIRLGGLLRAKGR